MATATYRVQLIVKFDGAKTYHVRRIVCVLSERRKIQDVMWGTWSCQNAWHLGLGGKWRGLESASDLVAAVPLGIMSCLHGS